MQIFDTCGQASSSVQQHLLEHLLFGGRQAWINKLVIPLKCILELVCPPLDAIYHCILLQIMRLQEGAQFTSFQLLLRCQGESSTAQGREGILGWNGFLDLSGDLGARGRQGVGDDAKVISADGVDSSVADAGNHLTICYAFAHFLHVRPELLQSLLPCLVNFFILEGHLVQVSRRALFTLQVKEHLSYPRLVVLHDGLECSLISHEVELLPCRLFPTEKLGGECAG